MAVNPIFAPILRGICPAPYPALSSDDVRGLRDEAIAWTHNSGEHPASNLIVATLCTEILQLRGEE